MLARAGACLLLGGCAASTVIRSTPPGARVFLDGAEVGETPFTLTDTKTIASSTSVRLESEGYEPFSDVLTRREEVDVLPLIGTICLVPGLWAMKYKPEHAYTLKPLSSKHRASRGR